MSHRFYFLSQNDFTLFCTYFHPMLCMPNFLNRSLPKLPESKLQSTDVSLMEVLLGIAIHTHKAHKAEICETEMSIQNITAEG